MKKTLISFTVVLQISRDREEEDIINYHSVCGIQFGAATATVKMFVLVFLAECRADLLHRKRTAVGRVGDAIDVIMLLNGGRNIPDP